MVAAGEGSADLALHASEGIIGDITRVAKDGMDGSCESVAVTVAGASAQIPKLVYVKYRDHVFFRNVQTTPTESVTREVVGWVKKETDEVILIECDRPVLQGFSGFNGVVVLKSCVVAMAELHSSDFEQILKRARTLQKSRVCAPRQRSEKLPPQIQKRRENR